MEQPRFVFVHNSYGDEVGVVTRPDLAKLLATLVPKEKIHFNTRVISTTQSDERVTLQCSDHKLYQGSILIGADGAYSNTRQTLYNSMAEQGTLPKSDGEPLGYGFDCAVGVTEPLDVALYPALKEKYCRFEIMLGKDIPYSVSVNDKTTLPKVICGSDNEAHRYMSLFTLN
jgi:2-polyprenyl-6-methoxyphenol hydroxylase-like FAD-dependent oxidoreductase